MIEFVDVVFILERILLHKSSELVVFDQSISTGDIKNFFRVFLAYVWKFLVGHC